MPISVLDQVRAVLFRNPEFNQDQVAEEIGIAKRTLIRRLKEDHRTSWRKVKAEYVDDDPHEDDTEVPISVSAPPPPAPSAPPIEGNRIDLPFLERYLIRLTQFEEKPTPQTAQQIANYLDKQELFKPQKDARIDIDPADLIAQAEEFITNVRTRHDPPPALPAEPSRV